MVDALPADIAVRLAAEGVPVRAIARAINVSSAELWQELNEARLNGRIQGVPREAWPTPAPQRLIDPSYLERLDEQSLVSATMRVFALTPLQARLLLVLMRSSETVPHDRLRDLYDDNRTTWGNVKVQIFKTRQRLDPLRIEIETNWGRGYRMAQEHRLKAIHMLLGELETLNGSFNRSAKHSDIRRG